MINETNYFNDIVNIFEYLNNKKITYNLVNYFNTDFIVLKCGIVFRNNKLTKNRDLMIIKPDKTTGYVKLNLTNNKERLKLGIHRLIYLAFNQNWDINIANCNNAIDHINHNKTYNSYSNLRLVNNSENQFNTPNIKGYWFIKDLNKYRASINLNKKQIHLGYFKSSGEAHFAYLVAKKKYHRFREL